MTGPGSRGQEQVPCKENIVTAWEKRLADAASVFQPLNAMNGPELEKQRIEGPNCTLPKRLGGAGVLADDSRFPTLDLTTGLGKPVGRPALSPPQVLNGTQHRTPTVLEGHQEAMNVVMQVLKEGEEADAILWRNLAFTRKRRDEQLRVVLNKINDGKETTTLLFRERMGFPNIVNSWKQEMILQKQKHDRIVTEMQEERKKSETLIVQKYEKIVTDMQGAPRKETDLALLIQKHERIVTEMQEERKKSETLIVQKYEKIVTDMQGAPRKETDLALLIQKHERIVTEMQEARKEAETTLLQRHGKMVVEMQEARKEAETLLIQKHEKIVTEMDDARKEAEAALIQKHERIVTEMQDARKEAETALTQKHERIVTEMQDARKEAETALIQQHERIVTEMQEERKKSETLLVQKYEKIVTEMQEARKEAETLLIQEQEVTVTEMQDAHEADKRLFQRYEKIIREFEMQEARKKADQIMFVHNHKKLLSAQVEAQRKAEILLNQKHGKTVTEMEEAHKEAEKLLIQKYEKLLTEVDDTRKENEARLLKELKVETDARKEREKEMLQKHSDLEAEVVKFTNMYYMALTSYQREKEEKTITEKEYAEAKQALHAQLESLQSQLAAMNAEPESPESQLTMSKEAVKIVSEKDLQLLALQSQLADLQEDKVKLQEALDALRDHQDSRIKSESDRASIEILWEVAQKVLTFPEDVKESQIVNTSGYETLLASRGENSVDKMTACVNAALKNAVKNWKTARDDVEKIKLSLRKHIMDTIMGREDHASGDVLCISEDSENESMEEQPQKKRIRLALEAELKERRSSTPPSSQQTTLSRRKRMTPQRFVPGS